jgi:hypothetical protein
MSISLTLAPHLVLCVDSHPRSRRHDGHRGDR